MSLATLDDPNAIYPEMHIWTSSRLDWVRFDDGLPEYAEGLLELEAGIGPAL